MLTLEPGGYIARFVMDGLQPLERRFEVLCGEETPLAAKGSRRLLPDVALCVRHRDGRGDGGTTRPGNFGFF